MDQVPPGGYSLLGAFQALLPEFHLRSATAVMRAKSFQGPSEAGEVVRLREILWVELSSRLQAGTLAATGFSRGATSPGPIHPAFFNNAVPDYAEDTVSMNGATYAGVRVFPADARPVFQQTSSSEIASESKNSGGAPARYDWDAFFVEIVRMAFKGNFLTRADLRKHMREWCDREWGHLGQAPDDRTIRRRVDTYCPPDIPDK